MIGNIFVSKEKCTGCGSCMVACSYHMSGTFQPFQSRIQVVSEPGKSEIEIRLGDCDLCQGEERPLCVKYCSPKALEYCPEAK